MSIRENRRNKKRAKKLEIIKIDELEEFERKINFTVLKNRFWETK